MKLSWWILGLVYLTGFLAYSLFSFSLTAPNLILTSFEPYWRFQTWMWEHLFNNRQLLGQLFLVLSVWLIIWYALVLAKLAKWQNSVRKSSSKPKIRWQPLALMVGLALSVLVLASPALSYDVFNYIFNAKMVLFYEADPHTMVALDFAHDDWLRFMHNTHTPAPYGQGWTTLSLLPYWLGAGKFTLTLYLFKVFSLLSLGLLGLTYWWANRNQKISNSGWWLALAVLLNPLLLIEVVGNVHNDLFMMVPAIFALILLTKRLEKLNQGQKIKSRWSTNSLVIFSGLAMMGSISVKLATVTLAPLWIWIVLLLVFNRLYTFVGRFTRAHRPTLALASWLSSLTLIWWPILASVAMFIPLFTERSQWFLPWYLIWSLVWLGLFRSTYPQTLPKFGFKSLQKSYLFLVKFADNFSLIWISFILAFSASSLGRYFPALSQGGYSDQIQVESRLITWLGAVILLPFCYALVRKSLKKILDHEALTN